MIVVNLNKTYPEWVRGFAAGIPANLNQVKVSALAGLRDICAGEWWQLTDHTIALNAHDGLLLGCYNSQVVAAYHIVDHRQNSTNGRVTFTLKPAYDYAAIIGAAQPGGPWAKGERRGWRMVDDTNFVTKYKAAKPNTAAWKYHVSEIAVFQAKQLTREAVPSEPVTQPAEVSFRWPHTEEISLRWTSTGLLEIHLTEDIRIRTVRRPLAKRRRRSRGRSSSTTTASRSPQTRTSRTAKASPPNTAAVEPVPEAPDSTPLSE